MEGATQDRFLRLLTESRKELQKAAGNYKHLLEQLDELERILQATQRLFLEFPYLQPQRGAARFDDGLDSTRDLVEILNRIVILSAGTSDPRSAKEANRP
jgi:hypothetical protein